MKKFNDQINKKPTTMQIKKRGGTLTPIEVIRPRRVLPKKNYPTPPPVNFNLGNSNVTNIFKDKFQSEIGSSNQ